MKDHASNQDTLFEFEQGELSASVILVHDDVMGGEPGPVIFPTLDKTRVIAAFSEKVFRARLDRFVRFELKDCSGVDPEGVRARCESLMLGSMESVARGIVDTYFEVLGLDHLGAPVEDEFLGIRLEDSANHN